MRSRQSLRASQIDLRARRAVAALFLTNGAIFSTILPRFPEIKAALELSNSTYGLSLAAFPCGAILAGLGAAALIRRFGSARVAVLGTILTSAGVLIAGLAPNLILFALGLMLGGGMDAITDVAQNAHGLRVQRRYGRSILNSSCCVVRGCGVRRIDGRRGDCGGPADRRAFGDFRDRVLERATHRAAILLARAGRRGRAWAPRGS
ncbi:MFS transporter [Cumulibacter soli]|uniref:MFS transporter n=1 Tax=Cumulibacter soli TaxID=2546344 RepID=UPI001ABB20B1|nr:MFS transporter [Cumulibacter soli]